MIAKLMEPVLPEKRESSINYLGGTFNSVDKGTENDDAELFGGQMVQDGNWQPDAIGDHVDTSKRICDW